jgi:hypothetical protein
MKFLLKIRNIILTSLLLFVISGNAQFAPPVGVQGTTAIHKDSSIFVNWATDCEVVLGTENISDPQSPVVSTGINTMAIGEPGNGVVSLGDGGSAILSFENKITNGEGWDFAVFENAFSDDFLELAFVEVSSDGINFFRFPSTSLTQDAIQIGPFGAVIAEEINNLAGKYRANYGTPFDLEEISDVDGLDVNTISHIKLMDVIGSINDNYCSFDHLGNKINDPFPTPFPSSGFDLDAVGVINQLPLRVHNTNIQNNPIKAMVVKQNNIELSLEIKKPNLWTFNIVNINGQIISRETSFINRENNLKNISISHLKSGLYLINIRSETVVKSLKFLKQ